MSSSSCTVSKETPRSNGTLGACELFCTLCNAQFSVSVCVGAVAPFLKGLSGSTLQATEDLLSGNRALALRFLQFISESHSLRAPDKFWGAVVGGDCLDSQHALIVLHATTKTTRPSKERLCPVAKTSRTFPISSL